MLGGVVLAFVLGIIFWGGFNTVLEWTNREAFCISCHEMKDNVFAEYRNTIHYQNRTGVRATCPDCHVPKEWVPKIIRKIQASNEVWHKLLGSIDTPEKFNAKRAELAGHEWARMKANDSQECRNCHNYSYMDYAEQNRRAATTHQNAFIRSAVRMNPFALRRHDGRVVLWSVTGNARNWPRRRTNRASCSRHIATACSAWLRPPT